MMSVHAMKNWVRCYQIVLYGDLKLTYEAGTSRRNGWRNFRKMEGQAW